MASSRFRAFLLLVCLILNILSSRSVVARPASGNELEGQSIWKTPHNILIQLPVKCILLLAFTISLLLAA